MTKMEKGRMENYIRQERADIEDFEAVVNITVKRKAIMSLLEDAVSENDSELVVGLQRMYVKLSRSLGSIKMRLLRIDENAHN